MKNKQRIYIVRDGRGRTWRIRATGHDRSYNEDSEIEELTFDDGEQEKVARIMVQVPYEVIPEDMLFRSISDDLIFPVVPDTGKDGLDSFTDALFSEADKEPFAPEERNLLHNLFDSAKERIRQEFQTSPSQQAEIEEKLNYLKRKVDQLDKFNWKRLFVSSLIGIAVDLCFGTLIPAALLNIFKEVLAHFSKKLGNS